MKIEIVNRHVKITRKLKQHIEQRVGLALGRFADRISAVSVKFEAGSVNGSANEKRCLVEIAMRKKVSVEAAHSDVFAAVDHALDNATRSVARALERDTASVRPAKARRVVPVS